MFRYKYIWKKTSEDIKNGLYSYAGTLLNVLIALLRHPVVNRLAISALKPFEDEKYLKYFMKYERKFKKTQSLRDFMEQDDDYPKEIFGDQQVLRLNPRPIHYEF